MTDGREPVSNDLLDQWLSEARWPGATRDSAQRLRQRWDELSWRRSVAWARVGMAMAASVAVVVGVWLANRPGDRPVDAISLAAKPAVEVALPGRTPTPGEMILYQAALRKPRRVEPDGAVVVHAPAVAETPVAAPVSPYAKLWHGSAADFQRYLEQIADDATRPKALAALDGHGDVPTDRLLKALSGPRADLRVAAALALGRIDGPVLTGRLIGMIERKQSRREAFIALASSRGREAKLYMQAAAVSEQYAGMARSAMIASEEQ